MQVSYLSCVLHAPPNSIILEKFHRIRPSPRSRVIFRNKLLFYDVDLLTHWTTPKLPGPPLVCCAQRLI
jgi:hypothetical protein